MRFVIITGYSGSGKSNTMRCMEDMGFFCVDNLPPVLIPKFAEVCMQGGSRMERVAVVVDVRGGELFHAINEALIHLEEMNFPYEILFLEADEDTLVHRYKETRRAHPMSPEGRVIDGIRKEQVLLADIKQNATKIINTTDLLPSKLREILYKEFGNNLFDSMRVTVVSFGFKRGIPTDADMVLDVRFLPNPFYISSLRRSSGKDESVRDYVFSFDEANQFVDKALDLIEYILPFYRKEAKPDIVLAIGCTGGMHRSVAIAEAIYARLSSQGRRVTVEHRDLEHEKRGLKYRPVE